MFGFRLTSSFLAVREIDQVSKAKVTIGKETEDNMMYGPLSTEFYDADKTFAPEDEIDFYKSLFTQGDLILDLMCGSGRLLISLLKEGYTIHGIDNSTHMLKSCRERASTFGLTPTLFESSIEDASLPGQYDAIIIPFGSFQLFFPRVYAMQMLEKIKTFLKPNGKLVMDMFIPWHSLWENAGEKPFFREIQTGENTMIKIEGVGKGIIDKYEQYNFDTAIYTKTINGRVVAQEEEQMHVSWYYRYEMELILEKYGFKNIRVENRYLNKADQMTFIAELK